MKTPREILFGRHKTAEQKLDAIRETVVAEQLMASGGKKQRSRGFSPAFVVMKLWQELVWPCRCIWLGMAAVWVVVLLLGFASAESGTVVADNDSPPPTPEVMMALKEQKQMMAQLLDGAPSEAITRPRIPGPRSEQRQTITAV